MTTTHLTVRNVPVELADRLRAIAKEQGVSLDVTVLRLLTEALGIEERRARFARCATWMDDEFRDFEEIVREQRQVEEDLWK